MKDVSLLPLPPALSVLSLSLSETDFTKKGWLLIAYTVKAGEGVHCKDCLKDEICHSKCMEDILDRIIHRVHHSK